MSKLIKSYSELIKIPTYAERLKYLDAGCNPVGVQTFGDDRYLNQLLYSSGEWKRFRRDILIRDNGCDLGIDGLYILGSPHVHHINHITVDDVLNRAPCLFDPENVISVSHHTHNVIHHKSIEKHLAGPIERTPGDTCPWKRK